MNKITEITKRDIYELFLNGIDSGLPFETEKIKYPYYGRLTEIEFLENLYSLENMPSTDPRFENAKEDIKYHTINNDDYPACWIFTDERFPLMKGKDEDLLDFLCQIFHPIARIEGSYWKDFLDQTNKYLRNDGYEIYTHENISNKPVYTWRKYEESDHIFIPFSIRYKNEIKNKSIKLHITKSARKQIYNTLIKFDFEYLYYDENGLERSKMFSLDVYEKLKNFYTPKCFNHKSDYVKTKNLEKFICNNLPMMVLDVIEAFYKGDDNNYIHEINNVLSLNNIPYILNNEGKFENKLDVRLSEDTIDNLNEIGIEELLKTAQSFYDKGEKDIAVEKMWDAFERLKSYYVPTLDKKKSINKIIKNISKSNTFFSDLFNKEFNELTMLGNTLRIRHHEKGKQEIIDNNYYDYLYQRCLSLVMLASKYL